ncbi:ketopantoate reductase family protein [bacterium]
MSETMNVIFFGVGAVGGTVGGWIAPKHENCFFLDQGPIAEALKAKGLNIYEQGKDNLAENVPVKVISDLSEVDSADVIVLSVKTYSLDKVSQIIKDKVGDDPIIVALQNGIDNQSILPKYFTKVIYGVVCYNAWLDDPAVAGYQKRGPIVLGTPDNSLSFEARAVSRIFNKGVETVVSNHFQDAVHSKMIINLTNSLTTLIGYGFEEITDFDLFQKLLANLTYEGVRIVKAAGYSECSLGGMPSWALLRAASQLPRFITRPLFKKNVKKMVVSSMAQDVIQRGASDSELETMNGYFVRLAEKVGVDAPYNTAIYEMCKEEFARPEFKPLDLKDIWKKVEERL